ncbi:MAG: ATP-binding cassette domain-containing protein [Symploca sp. SIO2E9]|nr:ATP-binding cassette domain-containing protein [Symploca sp. SIO2E9]
MSGSKGLYASKKNVFESLTDILNLLSLSSEDKYLESDFTQAFEISDFQLGDYLHSYIATNTSEDSVHDEHTQGLFIICQGRVRLLGFDTTQSKEVSVMVLEAGDSFGSEPLFVHIPALTRVIAASEGQIAWMPIAKLQSWLEKLPQLRQKLLESAQTRQSLVFFKTATQWRRLPVASLKQVLPYIEETLMPADEALIKSSDSGHFWLRSGEISKGKEITTSITGESWGYPEPIPAEWIAKTDLLVYKLPKEHWAVVAGLGVNLDSQDSKPIAAASGNGDLAQQNNGGVANRLRAIPPSNLHKKIPPKPPTPASNTESEKIDFPQPARLPRRRGFWQRYPFIQQHSSSDCGAACLAMIGRYWGKRFNLNSLRELAGVGRSGASLKGLARAAETLGFRSSPVRASLSRLVEQANPWVAHWQGDHYIVVYRVKGNRVILADPAMGVRSLSKQEFISNWTGYALLLDPTVQLAAAKDEKISLNRFWGLLWPHRGILLQVVLASLLLQVFGLITPLFTQIILDRVIVNKSLITLQVVAAGLVIFGLWGIGITATRRYLMDYYSNRLSLTFLSGFMNHTLRLPLKFFESRQVGDIITRVQETRKIQSFITKQAISTWLDVLMLFVSTGLMLYYNWQLTLLVLSTIPPIAILTVVASPFLRQLSREIFKASAEQNSKLVEMMSGVATVKASAAEQEVRWQWEELLTNQFNVRFKAQKLSNGLRSVSGFFKTISSTALLAYGANLVISDQLTIGQFVAFNMLIGRVTGPVLKLVGLWDQFQEILVSVERLNDIFATQPEENPREPMLVMPPIRGDVVLENITFRYSEEEDKNTLQNISLEVRAGQTIAIVGRSGSGKSTLVKLLQALYYPTQGRICIDGHDIRHVSPESLRSQLGVVPQECFLFSGTILENIVLYRPEFSLEQAIEAAKLAEAHAFIQSLPLGYNTKVGERGATLSGGQRQRIAIARALLGSPRILVLDEATSSLDTESERRFQQNLARISRERTTFIIAHRLSTVRNADCILVLDKGILAEQGNHEQLMALEGIYYHLARQQLEL